MLCLVTSVAAPLQAADETELEYRVKAAYLFQFGKFVQWPAAAFSSADSALVLCVVGEDRFGSLLDDTVKAKTVDGHPVQVQRVTRNATLRSCHILFVSGPETKSLGMILDKTRGAPVLLVGEAPEFARQGGIVNFVVEQNRVLFEVNPGAAERSQLHISSKLLSLARIVREGGTR